MIRRFLPLFVVGALGGALISGCTSRDDSPDVSSNAASDTDVVAAADAESNDVDATSAAPLAQLVRSNEVPNGVTDERGLTLPRGFVVEELASGLDVPRRMAFAPGATPNEYDVFVAESMAGRVRVLSVRNGKVVEESVFVSGLNKPYGLAFGNGFLYVANTDSVVRFPFERGQTKASGDGQKIADLPAEGYNQHWTRNLLFGPDGKKLFVSVGSSCNTCEEEEPARAAISVMNPDGTNKELYATGLRNPVGMALQPQTGALWTVVNERDNLGDDVPPDYFTKVEEGAFYGWPYAYTRINGEVRPDPTFGRGNTSKVRKTRRPEVPVQAHSAPLGVTFFPVNDGKQNIAGQAATNVPKAYQGDAILAYHGSWNRSQPTGYKLVRVDFENGAPRRVEDFLTGFLRPDGEVRGRPVDVQIAPDGSLLFSDDGSGKIWRVRYTG